MNGKSYMVNYLKFLFTFVLTVIVGVVFASQFGDSMFMYSLLITTMLGLNQYDLARLQNKRYN